MTLLAVSGGDNNNNNPNPDYIQGGDYFSFLVYAVNGYYCYRWIDYEPCGPYSWGYAVSTNGENIGAQYNLFFIGF